MDVNILKPDSGTIQLERPTPQSSQGSKATSESFTPISGKDQYTEPLSEGEDDEEMDMAVAAEEDKRVGVPSSEVAEAIAFRRLQLVQAANTEDTGNPGTIKQRPDDADIQLPGELNHGARLDVKAPVFSINPLVSAAAFDRELSTKLHGVKLSSRPGVDDPLHEDALTPPENEQPFLHRLLAPAGKRISVPVRVEPKVFFASERTFLVIIRWTVLR